MVAPNANIGGNDVTMDYQYKVDYAKFNIPYCTIKKQFGSQPEDYYFVDIPYLRTLTPAEGEVFLDVGCGRLKMPDMVGVDKRRLDGVDVVCDLEKESLPYADNSVDLIHTSMFLEHVVDLNKVLGELWRVLKTGHKLVVIVPDWKSSIQAADPDHKRQFDRETFMYFDRRTNNYILSDYGFIGDLRVLMSGVFRPGHILCVMEKVDV